jgi:hypothetical protein
MDLERSEAMLQGKLCCGFEQVLDLEYLHSRGPFLGP